MTIQEAKEIKAIVKKEVGDFTVYFNSKSGELRYTVAQWYDGSKADVEQLERKNILDILAALTKSGKRPVYRKASRRYQGFINCRYIIFQ